MENPTEVKEKAPIDKKKVAMEWIRDIVIAVIIAVVIVQFIKPTIVKESSMEPNFYANNYLFINKMAYKFDKTPKKGDVIVFKSNLLTETGKKKLLIKRVIGVPGDVIDIKDGKVYINGKEDDQSYTMSGETIGSIDGLTVPKGKLFCMGDNRDVSIDSRYEEVGCVSESKVVGKVVFRAFPFNKFGTIKNPYNK
ncbi:signal peptidase I [Aminicella lysinilytica]|uniref:Signal peptidase I n=1 Tax=Aminicella lysinilytica TaxID=433323 RepID=A0A4R6PXJ6_9FIRM|nr:signal peptidase I [Aminicella lysinilytica]TDP45916.1 signal peptidase I [Aminicella lysinilytica]